MDIDWIYEPETYDLGDGLLYCPDFLLPMFNGGTYIEVKYLSYNPTEYDKKRWEKLDKLIVFCFGVPDMKFYDSYNPEDKEEMQVGFKCADAYYENRFFWSPGDTDERGYVINGVEIDCYFNNHYQSAVQLARKIRFDTANEVLAEIKELQKEPQKIPY
jgi:hypothetical protein